MANVETCLFCGKRKAAVLMQRLLKDGEEV